MTDLIDIARSGLAAYRGALAATSENIANAATEGYLRRDVSIVPLGGAQATATTRASGGQGALISEVRRAFDGLAAARLRDTSGALAAAGAQADAARAIEALMLPGESGIDGAMRGFFDALADLSGNPTDGVTRSQVLQAGGELAGAVSSLAGDLADLRADLAARAGAAVGRAGELLGGLAALARRMAGAGSDASGALNALADRRDVLLGELSQILPVSVELGADGVPTVRLGHAAGPLLLRGDRSARLSVAADDLLTLGISTADGRAATSRSVTGGEIGGLSRALGALDMAAQDLDGLARALAGAANALHCQGIDQNGKPGGDLFRLQGWDATPAVANRGSLRIEVQTLPGADGGAVTLVYDAAASLWRARDLAGDEIATGTGTLDLPGLSVRLDGTPQDGDRVVLVPVAGRARDLAWLPADPAALAAAGAFATAPAVQNAGTATATVQLVPGAATGPGPLAEVTAGGTADLLGGVAGLVPAGTPALSLQSWGRSATTSVPFPAGATLLALDIDGRTASFDLSALADAAAAAAALQAGNLRSSGGQSLSALGLTVVAEAGGALRFVRPGTLLPVAVTLDSPEGPVAGTGTPGAAADGSLQVLTRSGRHVAGKPLTAAEAAALVTPENGFLPGAVYDPSPLVSGSAQGYRGTEVRQEETQGLQLLQLDAGGAARSVTLADASGAQATVALPEAASAALAAARLDGALPGLAARAHTALQLSGLPDGTVSFDLQGSNTGPLRVSATLADGNAAPLAQAVNALSTRTGIRAELSPDGARLLLVQDDGHDITLSALDLPPGGNLRATPAAPDGTPRGVPVELAAGMALRQGGHVELVAAQAFGVTEGVASLVSAPGGPGPAETVTAFAGAGVRLRFPATPPGVDGDMAFAVTLGGQTATAAVPAGSDAATVAAAVAASLRGAAGSAELTGAPLAALPPDGATLGLVVDGQPYLLRIDGGQPVVQGPEAGRVAASFDTSNRLVIRAAGVTDGRGIAVAASPALGFGPDEGTLAVTGRPPQAADLPATVEVEAGGQTFAVVLEPGSVAVPPGFPGTATVDAATGALRLVFAVPGNTPRIGTAAAAGFGGPGAAVRVEGDTVTLRGDGAALDVQVAATGALGRRIDLSGLPPEDLIVAMTGAGTLRLSAQAAPATPPGDPGAVEIVVTDAATGAVELRDSLTGDTIADGRLDAKGAVTLGGLSVRIAGTPATGDRFQIVPAAAGSADAAIARDLAALRQGDGTAGSPGMADRLARLQSDAGIRAAAAGRAQDTAAAAAETAERQVAAIGAVDLDTEAARLVELQQAYQASAQAISVARSLFDTLLGMF